MTACCAVVFGNTCTYCILQWLCYLFLYRTVYYIIIVIMNIMAIYLLARIPVKGLRNVLDKLIIAYFQCFTYVQCHAELTRLEA